MSHFHKQHLWKEFQTKKNIESSGSWPLGVGTALGDHHISPRFDPATRHLSIKHSKSLVTVDKACKTGWSSIKSVKSWKSCLRALGHPSTPSVNERLMLRLYSKPTQPWSSHIPKRTRPEKRKKCSLKTPQNPLLRSLGQNETPNSGHPSECGDDEMLPNRPVRQALARWVPALKACSDEDNAPRDPVAHLDLKNLPTKKKSPGSCRTQGWRICKQHATPPTGAKNGHTGNPYQPEKKKKNNSAPGEKKLWTQQLHHGLLTSFEGILLEKTQQRCHEAAAGTFLPRLWATEMQLPHLTPDRRMVLPPEIFGRNVIRSYIIEYQWIIESYTVLWYMRWNIGILL